jgi:SulP family sulfate permease
LSREQARNVKAISDADADELPLDSTERKLLDKAGGEVLYFYLSGPMIFSVSKAISRQHSSISGYRVMVLDLTDVPMIDVTVGLALENAVKDAQEVDCQVFLLCPQQQTQAQLNRLQLDKLIAPRHHFTSRYDALKAAVRYVEV